MSESARPVRIERNGDVAVVVLENPPLNLFTPAVFQALDAAVAELVALTAPERRDRARAVLFEARGKVVSAGVDGTVYQWDLRPQDAGPVGPGTWADLGSGDPAVAYRAVWSLAAKIASGTPSRTRRSPVR